MKKYILLSALAASLILTGCANKGIGVNVSPSSIQQTFETGKVISNKKVLIDEGYLKGVGTGAAVGAGTGALLGSVSSGKNALKGGLIGAVGGALIGAVATNASGGNEKEAYEIEIQSNNNLAIYRIHVEYDIPVGTEMQYVIRSDGKISNIDVKRAGKRAN